MQSQKDFLRIHLIKLQRENIEKGMRVVSKRFRLKPVSGKMLENVSTSSKGKAEKEV